MNLILDLYSPGLLFIEDNFENLVGPRDLRNYQISDSRILDRLAGSLKIGAHGAKIIYADLYLTEESEVTECLLTLEGNITALLKCYRDFSSDREKENYSFHEVLEKLILTLK